MIRNIYTPTSKKIGKLSLNHHMQYQILFEHFPLSIQILSQQGYTIYVNKAWEQLWGDHFERIKNNNILHDKQLTKIGVISYIKKAFEGNIVEVPPFKYKSIQSGKNISCFANNRWVKAYVYPLKDENDHIKEVILIHQDMSELKHRDEDFKVLASIVESAEDAIYSKSLDGTIINWNKGSQNLYGFTSIEAIGKKMTDLIVPKDKKNEIKNILSRISQGHSMEHYETIRVTKDQKRINVSVTVSPITDQNGKIIGASTIARDITEKKKLEETVDKERKRLDELVKNVPGVVWELCGAPDHPNQKISFISKYVEKMLGYPIDSWIRIPNFWLNIVHPDDKKRLLEEMTRIYYSGIEGLIHFRCLKKDGKYIWVEFRSYVVKDDSGAPMGMRGVTMDISEQIELERRKDEFISIASHELKTPITTIKGFTQILYQFFSENERASYYLTRMNEQVDRLTGLVNDLLDVSRVQTGKLELTKEPFDLTKLITEIIEDLQPTIKKHKIIFNNNSGLMIVGDRYRFSQVLINLISNAVKFSPKAERVIVELNKNKRSLILSIEDFGIGISQKNLDKIFNPFYQADSNIRQSFGGLGLGLYISSEIIKRHGGKIWVESQKGTGSKFYIKLLM